MGDAQRPEAQQSRQQQRDHRVADEQQKLVERAAGCGNQVGPAADKHQHHRQQNGRHGDAETRQFVARFAVEKLLFQRIVRRQLNARHDEFRVQRAGDDRGRNADRDGEQQGLPDRGLIGLHREHRRRVRWHQRMHHRQPGNHRQTDHQNRHANPPRHGEGDRHQQDETDFEEQRQADQKRDADHRPMRVLLAESLDQRPRHLLRSTGLGHHLAEHRPQCHHQRNMPQRLADARLIRTDHSRRRHPGHQRQAQGNQGDDNERIEPVTGDQHDQRDDGHGGVDQQPIAEGRRHAVLLERVTFEWVVKLINHFEIEISNRMKVIFVERQEVSLVDMWCRD